MSDIGHEQTDKELKKLEKKITQEYQKATKEVEKKMNDYLSKFAKKDKEMAKKVKNGEITSQEYAEWRQNQMLTGKRWEQMRDTLAQDLVNADKIAAGMINDTLPDAYALNFNYGTYEVESGAEINTSFTLYDHDTVERLMREDPKIIPKARIDIPKDQLWNRQKITSAVTQGILQGESIDKIAKRLGKVTDMDRNAAIRNARTYTTAAENGGRIDSYERANEQGIQVNKMWMATLDDRTRYEHRHLDGVSIPNDEAFEIDGYKIDYPGDPDAEPEMIYNCRCTLVADIKGIDYNDERNDSKLGEMTYDEWKHALDKRVAPGGTEEDEATNTTIETEKTNVEPNTKEEKPWTERIKELQEAEPTLDNIREAGSIIKEQVDNSDTMQRLRDRLERKTELQNKLEEETQKLNELRGTDPKYKEAVQMRLGYIDAERSKFFDSREEADNYFDEMGKAQDEAREAWYDFLKNNDTISQDEIANNLKDILSEVRDMGIEGVNWRDQFDDIHIKGATSLKWAMDKYPASWIEKSIDKGELTIKRARRGYYSNARKEICLSGEGDETKRTAVHELAHRMERVIPDILKSEKMFYYERTEGEELEWLGKGYDKDEKTRKDDFIDPYMGKDYGGTAYEIASMGFEMAYTNPTRLAKDEDMEALIYGLLATAD